jgi:hypothetical protein
MSQLTVSPFCPSLDTAAHLRGRPATWCHSLHHRLCGYGPEFHAIAADRLRHHCRPWRHVVHPDAGHGIIAPPFMPTTNSLSPGPGIMFDMGGTPEADAVARELSWTSTVDFLAEHLR